MPNIKAFVIGIYQLSVLMGFIGPDLWSSCLNFCAEKVAVLVKVINFLLLLSSLVCQGCREWTYSEKKNKQLENRERKWL